MIHPSTGRIIAGFLLTAAAWSAAEGASKRPLSEGEMDHVNAGGLEIVVRDTGGGAAATTPYGPLIVSQVVGDNQLTTTLHLSLSSDGRLPQSNEIVQVGEQSTESADGLAKVGGATVLRQLAPADLLQKNVMSAVVNSLNGTNQVTTSVNVQTGVPASALTGLQGGLQVSGADPSLGGAGTGSAALQPGAPGFQVPTTLSGGISLLETLVPTNPDLAPDLADLKALAAPSTSFRPSASSQPGRRR